MKVPPAGRRGVPIRYATGFVLALLTISACGVVDGTFQGGDTASEQVTSSATTEVATPSESSEPAAPAESESAPAATETPAGESGQNQVAVQPGGTLVDGATVSAELTRVGQRDRFSLDLGDAREFYIADMSGPDINLQVYSEVDGEPLYPANIALAYGTTVVKLTKAGAHRLEVFGNTNVVGAYSFRIATVKVRTFSTTIGLQVGEGGPAGAGRLDVPGRIDRFEFDSAGAATIKIVGGAGACGVIELELVDAAERNVANARQPIPLCGYEGDIALSKGDGRYALVVRSGSAKTGPYSFQIARVN